MSKYDDRHKAREAAYRSPVNPFAEGTRLHRYFALARRHVDDMDARFRDLEMVYGPIGDQKCGER